MKINLDFFRAKGAFILVALLACVSLLNACSTAQRKSELQRVSQRGAKAVIESNQPAQRMVWEIWEAFQDLNGQALRNHNLILGDELRQRGKNKEALASYLKASTESLDVAEAEAATLRLASQYLVLDNAEKTLSTTGVYFKQRGQGEAEVSVPFALILGFAYGRHGDTDQAMAWFSKVSTQGRPGGPAVSSATTGTNLLLRSLTPESFERIAINWQSDTFINQQVGRERLRRSNPGYLPVSSQSDGAAQQPFWLLQDEVSLSGDAPLSSAQIGAKPPVVGVILSLSDRFGALGRDTKQGFDLAVEANNTGPQKVSVVARDVGADTSAASAAVRELVASNNASVIAGPLLSEAALAAAETARELGVSLVSLSKSESFATGNGIFRLGATTTSQVDALVDSAVSDYGITRFAIAYPRNASGTEFLEAYRSKLGALNLPLELELSYSASDEASLLEVARQLEDSEVQGVLMPDSIEVSEKILRNFSSALRKRVRPLGTALWDNATKIARSQALFERSLFVAPFFTHSTRPEASGFVQSYRAKYNTAPNFLAAQGFDLGTVIMNAINQSGKSGGDFNSAMLQSPPYVGVTGVITILGSGELSRKFYVVEVLRDSFQEKSPGSSAEKLSIDHTTAAPVATAPILGVGERVESGY